MKNRSRMKIIAKASEIFDLPGEVTAGLTRITVTGCGKAHIENHRGLLEYGTEEIDINGGECIIKLSGKELTVTAMSDREMIASGSISSIEFIS